MSGAHRAIQIHCPDCNDELEHIPEWVSARANEPMFKCINRNCDNFRAENSEAEKWFTVSFFRQDSEVTSDSGGDLS